jgi:hypothetical protein
LKDKIEIDDLAEDVFGLNVRGIRSIGTIWVNPAAYFMAAREKSWSGRFTPSIRLWLSLIALTSLLQFIWIGGDTPLVSAYAEGFRSAGLTPPEGMNFEQLGQHTALWIYAIAPIIQLTLFLLVLGFFPFWGEKTTYGMRIRNIFAVMIPSATLLALFLPSMALIPSTHLAAFGYIIGIVTFALDGSTAYRAAFPSQTLLGRIWRAGVLTLSILMLNIAANIAAQVLGIVVVSYQLGLSMT